MGDSTDRKQAEREEFARLVLSIRKRLGESQEAFSRRFDQSSSSIFKWENCAQPDADRPIDPDGLAVRHWETLAALEQTTVPALRARIKGGEEPRPKSIAELVGDMGLLANQLKEAVSQSIVIPQSKPVNAIAAEFARSIQAASVETGLTVEAIAVQCGIEPTCLLLISIGQKVPSYRVAAALAGVLKDANGNLYSGEALLELLTEEKAIEQTKKPSQTKRRKASHGATN